MSNRLGGKQGTAYLGTNADQPPNYVFNDRDPNQYDINNVSLGDLWLNQIDKNLWVLVSLAGDSMSKGSIATWVKLETGSAPGGPLDTITGTSGGPIGADSNSNINLVSGVFGLSFDGNPATNTITLNSITPDNVLETVTGNNGGPISGIAGNINIVGDNVGVTITGNPLTNTLTASLIGGGDAAETFPTDSGTASASGGVLNINAGNAALNSGSSVFFSGTGDTVELNVTDINNNTIIGDTAGNLTLTGTKNSSLGVLSLNTLTSGNNNVTVGYGSGTAITSGSYNTCLGYLAGSSYVSTESSNIAINATGTAAESNVLRLGSGTGSSNGQINKAFISGIRGITPTINDGIPLFINSVGQLGTVGSGGTSFIQTVTGNSGGAVSPTAGGINIVGDGTTATVVGNPGTHTLTISTIGGGGGDLTVLAGDTGSATPTAGTINIITDVAAQACGSSIQFSASSSTVQLLVTDVGNNTIIGDTAGNATLTGTKNTSLGVLSTRALTSGNNNVTVGYGSGTAITSGSYNTCLGYLSGSSYTSSEASNILVNSTGTIADANTMRLGSGTGSGNAQINKAFISGIIGITPITTDGVPVFIGSAGQLGTVGTGGSTLISTITGNAGGAVGPSTGNVNFVGTGGVSVTGNPGTNTLTISATGGSGGLTSITGNTGGAQTGPAITLTGGATGASFGAVSNTFTMTFAGITANGGTVSLATDATTSTVNIGTGAGAKTVTVGSLNSTSSLTLNSGSGFITAKGVFGVTSASSVPLFINSSGKLGTVGGSSGFVTSLTGNTGGSVSSAGGNINIVGDGTSVNVVGNPGLNKLTISAIGGGSGAGNPAFSVYLLNNFVVSFIPPDSPFFAIPFDTLEYNLGAAYNLGTSTFTAPTTGLYNFAYTIYASAPTSTRKCLLLDTTNFTYVGPVNTTTTGGGLGAINYNSSDYFTLMDAGDTAQFIYNYPAGSQTGTITIFGTSGFNTPGILTSFGGSFISHT